MSQRLRIALAQLNFQVGDLEGNADKIIEAARAARDDHDAHLAAFPALSLIGCPPDDLLLRTGLPARVDTAMERIRGAVRGIHVVLGYPEFADGGPYNAAAVFRDGEWLAGCRKRRLANYGVFDEQRHFHAGEGPCMMAIAGLDVAIAVGEDLGESAPAARTLVNIAASPFHETQSEDRLNALSARARSSGQSVCYVNCTGGHDELIFDGDSSVVGADGERVFQAPAFEEGLYCADFDGQGVPIPQSMGAAAQSIEATVYQGLIRAISDYVARNGFPGVLVGLSGGIDSALTLVLACDALGPERVWAVSMPSRYTASDSRELAAEQARAVSARFDEIFIEDVFTAFLDTLAPQFQGQEADTTEENIQPRIRGTLLMALSNKFGHLLLASGNKSELAVGYTTLYGDMCGGFVPLKDVYKTLVYRLVRYRNDDSQVIPERVIERAPSAELAPGQQDADSLPAYDVLDPILMAYVEDCLSVGDIVAQGFDEAEVRKAVALVRKNEYKRQQAPPGPKITRRAFGRDRRYPITAVYGDL
jgi:NAD+ synthase (glutamine-hydrolysing)